MSLFQLPQSPDLERHTLLLLLLLSLGFHIFQLS